MSEPVLLAILFADRIITEDNGKKGLIGIFQRMSADRFPATFPPWAVYVAITNSTGNRPFKLTLQSVEDGKVIFPIEGNFNAGSHEDVVELAVSVSGAVFPIPGKYVLTFDVEGERLGSRILYIQQESENQRD